MKMIKSYELHLPVFKRGCDLHGHIEDAKGDVAEGFRLQAETYEFAAEMCRKMAGIAKETPELQIEADTHFIGVHGPSEERLDILVKDGLLDVYEWEDEDDEEDLPEDWEEEETEDLDPPA